MRVSPGKADRRKSRRVPTSLHAHCQIGTRYVREALGDLSVTGFFLRTREPVREGSPVRAAVALPQADGPRFLTLVGSVARVTREGLGVIFSRRETSATDLTALERFIDGRR